MDTGKYAFHFIRITQDLNAPNKITEVILCPEQINWNDYMFNIPIYICQLILLSLFQQNIVQ